MVLIGWLVLADKPWGVADYEVLATHEDGGWLSIDILSERVPLDAAKDCVARSVSSGVVSCYAFASREAHGAAGPISSPL